MSESRKILPIQKTYEALFALKDLREIFRQSLPIGFDELRRFQAVTQSIVNKSPAKAVL